MTEKQQNCTHKFRFKQTKTGMRRKCRRCGLTVTQVPSGVFGHFEKKEKHGK